MYNILPRYLSYIFKLQLVLSAFSLILGEPFLVSLSPLSKKEKFVGKIYREIVLHEGTNDQIIPRGK